MYDSHIDSFKRLNALGLTVDNVLDIGAHKGQWSQAIRDSCYPNAKFTLIEAIDFEELKDPHLNPFFHNLSTKILLLDENIRKVTWYQKGVGNSGDSIYRERTGAFRECQEIERETTTLDKVFDNHVSFDLIKIDTQGAEIPILKGGSNTIKNTSVILLELPLAGQYNDGAPNFLEHIQFMNSIGFVPFDIPDLSNTLFDALLVQLDVVFVRKNHQILHKTQMIIDNAFL